MIFADIADWSDMASGGITQDKGVDDEEETYHFNYLWFVLCRLLYGWGSGSGSFEYWWASIAMAGSWPNYL